MRSVLYAALAAFLLSCSGGQAPYPDLKGAQIDIRILRAGKEKDGFISPEKDGLLTRIKMSKGNGSPEDPYMCLLTVRNPGDAPWQGIIRVGILGPDTTGRFVLPGFMYGTNQGEAAFNPQLLKQHPRLRRGKVSPPYSPYWYARSDQLTHPVAMMHNGKVLYGISAEPVRENHRYNGFWCSLENRASVGFTVGYTEMPGLYISPWEYLHHPAEGDGHISIEPGTVFEVSFTVYAQNTEKASDAGQILREIYHRYHVPPHINSTAETAVRNIAHAIHNDAYGRNYKTYALTWKESLPFDPEKDQYPLRFELFNSPDDSYEKHFEGLIGWTNGTVIALPLLMASRRLGQPEYREQALTVLDNIVAHSLNPATSLPYCTQVDGNWTNRGWWAQWIDSEGVKPAHSSYITGQALFYLLKAYELEAEFGVNHTDWLSWVEDILEVVQRGQTEEGAFPRFWSETDGSGSEYDAFSGCWVAAAMALFHRITDKTRFLGPAVRAEEYYHRAVRSFECIKTPLDVSDAPDSEGILAYVRLTRLLHQITGEPQFLDNLEEGLHYSFSYKFCYNVPLTQSPLDRMDWSSCGGDITSVGNAVIHCMSNSILDEILYCYRQTGDPYYRDRLTDTYFWGLQAYNREDNEFFFGKQGWSTEYFCQSNRYVLDIRLEDETRSNIWFAYHPWATASILEGLCGDLWNLDVANEMD